MIRQIPTTACFDISVRKRVSFFRTFRVTNRLGEILALADSDILTGAVYPDQACICPKIFEFCVTPSGVCGEYTIMLDARQTEKLETRWSYFFAIDLNPRAPIETLDREIKVGEFDFLGTSPDLAFEDYTNYMKLEPHLPHLPSFRLAEGRVEVKA